MQYHNTKDQNKGNKVSNDLAGLIATSNATVNDWSVMSKFLDSKDKDGIYTLQSFEQALELVSIPAMVEKKVIINGKSQTQNVCVDSLELQNRRFDCVKRTFFAFRSLNTGFPEYLAEKYQPRFNPKQLVELIKKELEHGNPAVRRRGHQMIGY